ncbi:hypothetical protein RR48_00973 [Papilio machaon]|uniref:MADF domain-containing protein n=1 Tax=Papilio machaon TaxID=76193 RepID=A0A0N1IGK5_PAPMA|nr:hypothetical protein RR48_00973 [Papilio machaon]
MNHIDTGRVIDEVRIRRCLWDPADDFYKNKDAKNKAWEEIGKELCGENFNTDLENEVTESLSDNQSIVSEDLTETATSANNLSTPSQLHRPQENTENSQNKWNKRSGMNKRKSEQSNFENELITLLNQNTSNLNPDDLSFFESLGPILSNLSAYQKLQFRAKVLELLIGISAPTTTTPSFSSPENNVNPSVNANSTYNYTTQTLPLHNYTFAYATTSTPQQQLYESAVELSNVVSPTGDNNSNYPDNEDQ